jgi:hypothetical protein
LQNSFKRGLEEYNLVEKRSREKYRDRMARQIKIGSSPLRLLFLLSFPPPFPPSFGSY